MNKVILNIGGMSCSACSIGLEKYLNKQKGVQSASVNLVLAQAVILYDQSVTIDDLEKYVFDAGFESLGVYDQKLKVEKIKRNDKMLLIIFGILSVIMLYISMMHMFHLPIIPFLSMEKYPVNYSVSLFILATFFMIYGMDIFKSGYKNLSHKTPNMDTLVSIGVLSSFLYSIFGMLMIIGGNVSYVHSLYFESSAMVLFFIKLGRFIDSRSKEKTKLAIQELVQITPTIALKKTSTSEKEVTIDEIEKGDILICKPGMKIAVDGIIVDGDAHLDESFITGESMPIKRKRGDRVVAGSINYDGYFEYEALKIGKESMISEIVRLVLEATNTKAPISRLADKVSSYFVPFIMILSFFTFFGYLLLDYSFSFALEHFVTVLVVACPCALGLATPLAIVISEGICAKNGILVKTSTTLENVHKVDTVVFDKTGTLTYGNLKISKIYNYSAYNDEKLIQLVASLEAKSTHPISKAFLDYSKGHHIPLVSVSQFCNIAGSGLQANIEGKKIYIGNHKIISRLKIKNIHGDDEISLTELGNSIVYVIENRKVIALIGVKDIIREDAISTVKTLKDMGKEVIMLTGDNQNTANIIAKQLKIDTVIADLLPKDKAKMIQKMVDSFKMVMMVGDGINDAPSLASSSIGVSVSSGTDIANDSSDVILMNDHLDNLIKLFIVSKKTIRNIKQNLFWAFFYNVCMIPIAMGLFSSFNISMNPMLAGIAMTISSLTVVLNALRLKNVI